MSQQTMNTGTSSEKRPPAANITPAELVDRLLSTSEGLADVVRRETVCLKEGKPLSIEALQEEKTRLANEYAMDIQAVARRKEMIDRAPADRVARLKSSMTGLNMALSENRIALDAAKSVSERILKSIAAHVGERNAPALNYGRNAAVAQKGPARAAAIALDARV